MSEIEEFKGGEEFCRIDSSRGTGLGPRLFFCAFL